MIFVMPGQRFNSKPYLVNVLLLYYGEEKIAEELSEMFSLKLRTVYNIINGAEKEGRLEPHTSTGPQKRLTPRIAFFAECVKAAFD